MSTIPVGYKQTEIGVIPEDWNVLPFKNISTMNGRIGWQGLKQNEFSDKNDEPFLITGMNFKDGKIRWDEVYHFPIQRYKEAINIQLRVDDVLMTKDGTIGKLLFVDDIPYPHIASLNSHLLVFRPKNNAYNSKFLYYQLHSTPFLKHIELTKSGTTFFGITQESVGKYNVYLPSISEQQLIATALSDIDALIESLEKLIAKKRQIKQGAMQELLSPKEGWEVKSLEDIATFKNGKAHENSISDSGKYIVVNSKFISTDGEVKKYSNDNFLPASEGDVLMVMSDVPNGKAIAKCFVVDRDNTYTVNQRICVISPLNIDGKFLFYKLNRHPYYLSFDDGVKQTNLRKNDVLSCPLYIPSTKAEQTAIATILTDMDVEITALESRLEKTRTLKSGMMHELLTGRIRLI